MAGKTRSKKKIGKAVKSFFINSYTGENRGNSC
jgi:hypothetical protein